MRICVVGAGIAGAFAARLLARRGHEVTVLERRVSPEGGAGIVLTPRALAALASDGVRPQVRHLARGVVLTTARGRDVVASGARGSLRREALAAALAEGLDAVAEVRRAAPLLGLSVDREGVHCRFSGGEARFDLVIGADGLHSTVRALIRPDVPVRSAGQVCWRAVVPQLLAETASETWHAGLRVGVVPLPGRQTYVYAVVRGPLDAPVPEPRGLHPVPTLALRLLRELPGSERLRHDLGEVRRPVWGADRVVLIGDAAHGVLPNLGSGAALGIGDAVHLATELDREIAGAAQRLGRARAVPVGVTRHAARVLGALAHPAHSRVPAEVRVTARRLVAATVLAGLAALHVGCAFGSPWPATSRRQLGLAVLGAAEMPHQRPTLAVTGGLALAAATAAVAPRGAMPRRLLAAAFAARAIMPARAVDLVRRPDPASRFCRWNAWCYRPLTALLAVLIAAG